MADDRSAEEAVERICRAGALLAAVGLAAVFFAQVVNHALFDGEVWNLNPGTEGNSWTWASTVAVFAAGFAALLRAVVVEERRGTFGLLAVALLYFSLDDAVEIHEQVGRGVGTRLLESAPGYLQNRVWLILYVPLLVYVALTLWRESEGPAKAQRTLRQGLYLLVAAVIVEGLGVVTKPLADRDVAWPDILRVGLEEGVELAGWIVVAAGLTALTYLALQPRSGVGAPETASRP